MYTEYLPLSRSIMRCIKANNKNREVTRRIIIAFDPIRGGSVNVKRSLSVHNVPNINGLEKG